MTNTKDSGDTYRKKMKQWLEDSEDFRLIAEILLQPYLSNLSSWGLFIHEFPSHWSSASEYYLYMSDLSVEDAILLFKCEDSRAQTAVSIMTGYGDELFSVGKAIENGITATETMFLEEVIGEKVLKDKFNGGVFNLQILLYRIDKIMQSYSVRPANAIRDYLHSIDDNVRRFYETITREGFSPKEIRGIGVASVQESWEMLERIEELIARHLSTDDPLYSRHERYHYILLNNGTSSIGGKTPDCNLGNDAFPDNIEELMPVVQKMIEPLPERSRIVFDALFMPNNNSLAELYKTISEPSFSAPPLPFSPNWYFYRGNRLVNEKISEIKSFMDQFRGQSAGEKVEWALRDESLSDLLPENYKKRKVYELERILGYFPGYYLAWEVIQNMKIEELEFIDECIPYKEGQHILSSVDYSVIYDVSQGSVHQKKRRVIASLEKELKKVRAFLNDNTCHYSVTSESFLKNVNSMEDTGFDRDFLRWMTSVLYDGFHLIGNPVSVLSKKPVGRKSLTLVPSSVMDEFDVEAFMEGIGEMIKQKRTDDQRINLDELIIPYLKKGGTVSQVIEELCLGIIKDEFSLEVEKVSEERIESFRSKYWYRALFKANSYKSFPVIIYEILLKRGSSMTERQIASAIKKEYPERRFSKGAIGANALRHPNIVRFPEKPNSFALRGW